MRSSHHPRRRCRAFTLLELLSAIGIFCLMVVFLFMVVNNTANITVSTTGRLDANRTARECLDLIGRDLALARLPYGSSATNTAIVQTTPTLQMVVNSADVGARFRQPHSIFWQAPLARNQANGNLAVVGYYLIRDLNTSEPRQSRLQLRRLYIEPETAAGSVKYLVYNSQNTWFQDTLLEEFAPGTVDADKTSGQKGWVADGILAMWIRCLDPEGRPILTNANGDTRGYAFQSREGYSYVSPATDSKVLYPAGKPVAGVPKPALPAFIEIALVCASPRDAALIQSLPTPAAGNPAEFFDEVEDFTAEARSLNPRVKSIESYSRKFRLYPSL
jgi:hypothetical protein